MDYCGLTKITANMTNKITILQVAKITCFSKSIVIFLSFFCNFLNICDILHIFEKIAPE